MNREIRYQPTREDILSVLRLLHDNGLSVQNSKKAYEELQKYQANPSFCILLSHVFGADSSLIQELRIEDSWILYRQLAGITLKNNLEKARHSLGETAVGEAARCALGVLGNPVDIRIARVAAQIVVRITGLTSFEWWQHCGMGELSTLLLGQLLSESEVKTFSALYALQYLMEDLPKQVGYASKDIIERVVAVIMNGSATMNIRKAAFRMCSNMYEQASFLDWNLAELSPLQLGLAGASGIFASACTSLLEESCGGDIVLMVNVLRTCSLMLDYFEYFTSLGDVEMKRLVHWWIFNTICLISEKDIKNVCEGDIQQLKASGVDLLTTAMELHDRMGGEAPLSLLVEPIMNSLPTLIPVLVSFVPMSENEIESILSSDDYQVRETTAVNYHLSEHSKDISEDAFLDDDRAALTLRASALRCVDALCTFSSSQIFSLLMTQAQSLWVYSDRRFKEAAIVLIGTLARGCYNEIESLLPDVSQQLIKTASCSSEDVCVISIAIWSLSRILEWAYSCEDSVLTDIVMCFSTQMRTTSKRVQQASVSALNNAFITGHSLGTPEKLLGCVPFLVQTVLFCLPPYCDTNLSLLCDLALHLITITGCGAEMSQIHNAFQENRIVRARSFEASYAASFIDVTPNAHLDMDIFSIDRVITGFLTHFPDQSISLKILESWNVILKDFTERNIGDCTDLLLNAMYTCCNLLGVTTTTDLIEWSNRTHCSLARLTYEIFTGSNHQTVKTAAVTLLYRLLKGIGSDAFPEGMTDALFIALSSSLPYIDDPYDKLEFVRLVCLMVAVSPKELVSNGYNAYRVAVDALRSDAYNTSLVLFAQMAYNICATLEAVPALIGDSRLEVVLHIMSRSENSYEKSVATIQIVDALLSNEGVALTILPSAMSLVYSWQQSACNFPGTQDKLTSLMMFYSIHDELKFKENLSTLPPNFCKTITSTYGINWS